MSNNPGLDVSHEGEVPKVSTAKLFAAEIAWRDRQRFLETKGYMLRPRLRPDWVPSWKDTKDDDPFDHEDYIRLPFRRNLVDATRIADNRLVYVKRVPTGGHEIQIASIFSQDDLVSDPGNHCVPVLDSFCDDQDPSISYLVMPFLRLMDDPPFSHVNDIVDFVDQILQGLVFMHNQGVAHRDLAQKNLMMDATALYPRGFHPVEDDYLPDISGKAPVIPRLGVWPPVKYYIVDFGLAVRIPLEVQPKRALGNYGIDREVPELSTTIPYDPFKVDVFIVGNVFRQQICAKFANVNFLKPLARSMTVHEPSERPSADDALAQWRKIRGGICFVSRGAVLRPTAGSPPLVFDFIAFLKLGTLLSRRILMWAARWLALLNRL